jgi:hypothetical protein
MSSPPTSLVPESPGSHERESNLQVSENDGLPLHFSTDSPDTSASPVLIDPPDVEEDRLRNACYGNYRMYEEDGSITLRR